MNNSRALLLITFVMLFFLALIVKLVNIQIVDSEEYKYRAQKQQLMLETIKAERGYIYDRNSQLMVYNRNDVSIDIYLKSYSSKEKEKVANQFSKILGKSKNYYLRKLNSGRIYLTLADKVPVEKALKIKNLKIDALTFRDDPTRIYQYGKLASHIIGYVDNDYKGTNGVERSLDEWLKGEDGKILVERNAVGDMTTIKEEETKPAIQGANVYLTINKSYQIILEEELEKGLEEFGGNSATGVIMDPNTGEILALANAETFDPNIYWKFNDNERRNRAITDIYEPGSTFKTITIAALLDQNLCNLNEKVDVNYGRYKFKNVYITDTHGDSRNLSVREVIEQSSNVGISKLVQRIDEDLFYKYLRGFGFGNYTSIDLPGEVKGKLKKPNDWSLISKPYLSFGYEIAVTPLQLSAAYCALVNGGILYQPQIVRRIVNKNKGVDVKLSPEMVRRVISEKTSTKIRDILKGVVENGTGTYAKVKNLSVGGKTGTSQKLINGSYSTKSYNSSFIGFYPVEDPKVVCLILVDSPEKKRYGGLVAAPIFKNVTERIVNTNPKLFESPIYNLKTVKDDFKIAKVIESKTNAQLQNNIVPTKTLNEFNLNNSDKMPDLRGTSLRDAILILTRLGINYKVDGNGVVTAQSISPGTKLNRKSVQKINCEEVTVNGTTIY